jgi:hypothetical protein
MTTADMCKSRAKRHRTDRLTSYNSTINISHTSWPSYIYNPLSSTSVALEMDNKRVYKWKTLVNVDMCHGIQYNRDGSLSSRRIPPERQRKPPTNQTCDSQAKRHCIDTEYTGLKQQKEKQQSCWDARKNHQCIYVTIHKMEQTNDTKRHPYIWWWITEK